VNLIVDYAPDLANFTVDRDETFALQNSLKEEWIRLTGSSDDTVSVVRSIEEALDVFKSSPLGDRGKVLVCGSLHLLGGVLTIVGAEII
jgi:folylpolyglutamate synthase/dihydropteroate synthase